MNRLKYLIEILNVDGNVQIFDKLNQLVEFLPLSNTEREIREKSESLQILELIKKLCIKWQTKNTFQLWLEEEYEAFLNNLIRDHLQRNIPIENMPASFVRITLKNHNKHAKYTKNLRNSQNLAKEVGMSNKDIRALYQRYLESLEDAKMSFYQ